MKYLVLLGALLWPGLASADYAPDYYPIRSCLVSAGEFHSDGWEIHPIEKVDFKVRRHEGVVQDIAAVTLPGSDELTWFYYNRPRSIKWSNPFLYEQGLLEHGGYVIRIDGGYSVLVSVFVRFQEGVRVNCLLL